MSEIAVKTAVEREKPHWGSPWSRARELYSGLRGLDTEGKVGKVLQSEKFRERQFRQFFDTMSNSSLVQRTRNGRRSDAIIRTSEEQMITFTRISDSDSTGGDRRIITIGYGGPYQSLEYVLNPITQERNPYVSSERVRETIRDPKAFCVEVARLAGVAQHK